MTEKLLKRYSDVLCAMKFHLREHNGQRGFFGLGKCTNCGQEVVMRRADLRQATISYPLPDDCEKLVSATIEGYDGTYTVNEFEGELLVSPSPLRTHVRGLRITYVRKPTAE